MLCYPHMLCYTHMLCYPHMFQKDLSFISDNKNNIWPSSQAVVDTLSPPYAFLLQVFKKIVNTDVFSNKKLHVIRKITFNPFFRTKFNVE